ncbi:MAG: alpha/beta fold hydrolase [Candidatus Saccharimonadales bacterium]
MQIVVDKLLANYSTVGNGPRAILFLHGWADNSQSFLQLAQEIVAKDKTYTAVLLDLPGFGSTQAPAQAWDLPDYAHFVAKFLEKAKLQPVVILGHSNGGAIAINGIANGVLQTEKLILIGSAGIRNTSLKKTALRALAKPAKLALRAAPASTQKRVKQKLYSAIGSDYLVAAHMQDTFKHIVAYDVRQEATRITIPVCLIYGADDTATPPEYGKILANNIPGSKLEFIPLAGHFVHHEQLYKVARLCTNFITEAPQS